MSFEIHKKRREKLMNQMGEGVALIFGSTTSSSHGRFRQDNDFYYLTGLEEKNCLLVLLPKGEKKSILLLPPKDPKIETWEGPMVGLEGAVDQYEMDEAYSIDEGEEKLKDFLRNQPRLYYTFGLDEERDRKIHKTLKALRGEVRMGTTVPKVFYDLQAFVHDMRLIKDEREIELLRKAGSLTAKGHRSAMEFTGPGLWEYEVQGVIEYEFRRQGSFFNAFNSILAGGKNALVLHYEANQNQLKAGDLLLIDAGCEYQYYNGDISRTIPVSGKFTEPQKEIYNLVLKAQRTVIKMVKPGMLYEDLHNKTLQIMTQGLVDLGLLEGEVDQLIEEKKYEDFFMHKTGHWIGMACHDVGEYAVEGKSRPLKAGMTFTVEPGLYIPDREDIPEKYRGIGIRIEDDILVTKEGYEILTKDIPSSVEEIEKIMEGNWNPQG